DLDVPTGRVEVVSPAERARIVGEWNDTGRLVHGGTVHGLFAEQVARTPVAVAGAGGGTSLTYAQLDARADRLGGLLGRAGGGAEGRVAVLADRSADLVVSALGVLKAGAAYVPLDVRSPVARLAVMVAETGPRLVLADPSWRELAAGLGAPVMVID